MDYLEALLSKVSIHIGDLPTPVVESARRVGLVAWDIETSGLNWKEDRIGTCQIYVPDSQVYIVRISSTPPRQLEALLNDANVCKVFHHAMFDLRFMVYQWSVGAQNVACTKIASKILDPSEKDHSLNSILQRHLGVSLDKGLRRSDWLIERLTQEQVKYAARDVLYLPQLLEKLQRTLMSCGRWCLAEACFTHLPVRVQLDILGCGDVFQY